MQILLQPCKYSSLFLHNNTVEISSFPLCPPLPKTLFSCPFSSSSLSSTARSLRSLVFSKKFPVFRNAHLTFCSRNDVFDGFSSTRFSNNSEEDSARENGELGLLDKPSPVPKDNDGSDLELKIDDGKVDEDEALKPFLKFFKKRDGVEEEEEEEGKVGVVNEAKSVLVDDEVAEEEERNVNVEYYEAKPGDFVVGVVVSGNENKLDVNVGADMLGTMLTKEVLPLYDKEIDYLMCDLSSDAEEFFVKGKMGVVKYDEAVSGGPMPGRPVVEPGTVLFAEVLGRTLSGRPLLSTRRLFRRIAWHRVRQIRQLNEPIQVRITEWNTGGLLTRIEGLRAFLPKAELLKRVNNFSELKEKVGSQICVLITRTNEEKNDLILSEREAWQMLYLQEGTLLEGTVRKIFPFGAQIRIGETNRSGLLHISNISQGQVTSVNDLLAVDEKVKVLVVKSMFPDKISLSIADLESQPGLFITDKERVFSEAEMMAKKYRKKVPAVSATGRSKSPPTSDTLTFEDEAKIYANWKWFKFERDENQPDP